MYLTMNTSDQYNAFLLKKKSYCHQIFECGWMDGWMHGWMDRWYLYFT